MHKKKIILFLDHVIFMKKLMIIIFILILLAGVTIIYRVSPKHTENSCTKTAGTDLENIDGVEIPKVVDDTKPLPSTRSCTTRSSSTYLWSDIGETEYDWFGVSVSSAGDVNKDGYDDIIVGAEQNDAGGTSAGKAYIYLGGASMSTTPFWTATGEAGYDYFGWYVSSAGDVNNDSYDDIIISATSNDDGGSDAGKVYVYFGGASMSTTPSWTDVGEAAGDLFGYSVSGAGDVNNDSYDDIIVGAYGFAGGLSVGKAYVYLGDSSMSSVPSWTAIGEAEGDVFGNSVSGAGDVNNDGYDDIIVGAVGSDNGGYDTGKAYVYDAIMMIKPENSAPIVNIIEPDRNETWTGAQDIIWTAIDPNGDDMTFDIYLSDLGGATYPAEPFLSDLSLTPTNFIENKYSYPWP
ncbi:FG-GAP repeat protein, partial [Candidatus Pacearchaeota archaeon]|nr:FG-GAP repeat protein [Candidatus Pacearchaeota archaeon]